MEKYLSLLKEKIVILDMPVIAKEISVFCKNVKSPRDYRLFIPSYEWLIEYGDWAGHHTYRYQFDKFDCEDFALLALTEATDALCQRSDIVDCGIAMGYCEVLKFLDPDINGYPHALNLCRCSDDKWYFFERQSGKINEYSKAISDGVYSSPTWVWM